MGRGLWRWWGRRTAWRWWGRRTASGLRSEYACSLGLRSLHAACAWRSRLAACGLAELACSLGLRSGHAACGLAELACSPGLRSGHAAWVRRSLHAACGLRSLHAACGSRSGHAACGLAELESSLGLAELACSLCFGGACMQPGSGGADMHDLTCMVPMQFDEVCARFAALTRCARFTATRCARSTALGEVYAMWNMRTVRAFSGTGLRHRHLLCMLAIVNVCMSCGISPGVCALVTSSLCDMANFPRL